MSTDHDLDTTIHVIAGRQPTPIALEKPLWSGPLHEYWRLNQHLLWGDISDLLSNIRHGGAHRTGGDAEPERTILSSYGRRCLINYHKIRKAVA